MIRHQCPHPYHQTTRRRTIEKGLLFIVIVGLILFFVLGRFSVKSVVEYQAENALLQASIVELTRANKELIKQQDFVESSKKIDAQAQKDSQRSLTKLHEELGDIKEQLAFYQRVVAPETLIKGLYINSFEIKPLNEEGIYEYQLVLAQGASQKRAVKGKYALSVVGDLLGEEKELLLKEMSVEKVKSYSFSFKYYELLMGEVKLPNSFVPKKVSVTVNQSKKGPKAIQQEWLWREVVI